MPKHVTPLPSQTFAPSVGSTRDQIDASWRILAYSHERLDQARRLLRASGGQLEARRRAAIANGNAALVAACEERIIQRELRAG